MTSSSSNGSSDHTADVIAAVGQILLERGIPPAEHDAVFAAIRAADEARGRRTTIDFWRGVAKRHGVKAASEACGLSRHVFLTILADIVEIGSFFNVLAENMYRGQQLDADAAARVTRRASP